MGHWLAQAANSTEYEEELAKLNLSADWGPWFHPHPWPHPHGPFHPPWHPHPHGPFHPPWHPCHHWLAQAANSTANEEELAKLNLSADWGPWFHPHPWPHPHPHGPFHPPLHPCHHWMASPAEAGANASEVDAPGPSPRNLRR